MIRPRRLSTDAPLVWSPGTGNQVWAVLSAAHAGDTAGLARALDAHPDLVRAQYRYRDWLSNTALHDLARRGDLEQTKLWLARGADRNAIDEERGWTPRRWAEEAGHAAVAEALR